MNNNLTVYPISSGDMLSIFSNENFGRIRIMDMAGNVVYDATIILTHNLQVDISALSRDTYIVEVGYANNKTARSVFVKT